MNFIPLVIVFSFILGAIIGSFLNVVILRMNTGRGVGGRSICFSCEKTLGALELVPVVSFFALGGKCRSCKRKISWQYPLVELATALAFAGIAANSIGMSADLFGAHFLFYTVIFSLLIVIVGYDMRHSIIPDRAVYAFIVLSFFAPLAAPHATSYFDSVWFDHIVAGIALSLPFASLWFFSKGRLMGFGDAKLALGIGFLLGLSQGVAAIMLAFWSGAIIGIILLLLKHRTLTMKSEIPFAPFLVAGVAIAFFFHIDLASLSLLLVFA